MKLPKEMIVSPEDSVTMVKLQSVGYWRTINTCPITPVQTAVTEKSFTGHEGHYSDGKMVKELPLPQCSKNKYHHLHLLVACSHSIQPGDV